MFNQRAASQGQTKRPTVRKNGRIGGNQGHNPHTGVRIGEASNPGPKKGSKPKAQGTAVARAQGEEPSLEEETIPPTAVEQVEDGSGMTQNTTDVPPATAEARDCGVEEGREQRDDPATEDSIFWALLGEEYPTQGEEPTLEEEPIPPTAVEQVEEGCGIAQDPTDVPPANAEARDYGVEED
eukprot:14630079-Heterocapsa_arctica.AAC.1